MVHSSYSLPRQRFEPRCSFKPHHIFSKSLPSFSHTFRFYRHLQIYKGCRCIPTVNPFFMVYLCKTWQFWIERVLPLPRNINPSGGADALAAFEECVADLISSSCLSALLEQQLFAFLPAIPSPPLFLLLQNALRPITPSLAPRHLRFTQNLTLPSLLLKYSKTTSKTPKPSSSKLPRATKSLAHCLFSDAQNGAAGDSFSTGINLISVKSPVHSWDSSISKSAMLLVIFV